ncbi:mitochondrial inner-membrane-bound regulator-domain-containing protein [Cercophora newfieldiana]|uniref:Mitochondrial inner-membrane-bound regulator-domain-containing protein n=1 Tax=Cercophora newfieldiana TaxID=92897 RepID=A0AA40D165_9PEZI|nr:mitochondrial inner-membrane-bound regulator-domain-containing protein [Cercophora newfieldiana]
MLRRKVTGSFVCLQCRLQLGTVGLRRHFSATAPARRDQQALSRQAVIDALSGFDRRLGTRDAPAPDTAKAQPPPDAPQAHDGQQTGTETLAGLQGASSGGQGLEDASPDDGSEQKMQNLFRTLLSSKKDRDGVVTPLSTKQYYKSRGKHLAAENEELAVDVMGRPSSAIVLRSSRRRAKTKAKDISKSPGAEEQEAKASKSQLLDAEMVETKDGEAQENQASKVRLDEILERDENYFTLSDALRHIDELRPSASQHLLPSDFEELKTRLDDGFTLFQLQQYIHTHYASPREPKVEEPKPDEPQGLQITNPPWVVKKQPWVPLPQDTADSAQGHLADLSSKERLVARLMRECWNLTSQSSFHIRGRLDVTLTDTEFGLLLLGTRKWLRDIARDTLSSGSQIEALVPSSTISIVAPKFAAEGILVEINNILCQSRTISIDRNLVASEKLNQELLEDVGRITNTLVRFGPSGKEILVSWINLPEPPKGSENLGDVVLRLLLSAHHSTTRTSSASTMLPASRAKSRAGGFVTRYDCQSQLPWYQHRKEWARWVAPTETQKKKGAETIRPSFLPHPIEINDWDPILSRKPGEPFRHRETQLARGGWSSELTTKTSAAFGHIVHSRPPNPGFKIRIEFKKSDRAFLPVLPPITALDLPTNLIEEGLWHSTIIIRFLPDPQHPLAPGTPPPPPLELNVEADHKELKRIIGLRAVTSSFTHDVLLPASPVDVRLLQERYFELPGASLDEHLPVVIDFLNKSDLRPWDNKLITPPTLPGVRLPRRLLETDNPSQNVNKTKVTKCEETATKTAASTASVAQGESIDELPELGTTSETKKEPKDDFVTVNYRFVGIEIQRSVTAEYEGFKLSYRSTQAGKYTNKSAQVSLEAVAVDKNLLGPDGKPAALEGDAVSEAQTSSPAKKPDAAAYMNVVSAMANKLVSRGSKFGWEVRG